MRWALALDLRDPLYERQKGERSKTFEYFRQYRDMGPSRTLAKLRAQLGGKPSETMLENHSVCYGWGRRAQAWDDHLDKLARESREKEVQEFEDRDLRVTDHAAGQLTRRLVGDPTGGIQQADVNSVDYVNAIKSYVELGKYRRVQRGLPNDVSRQQIA